MSLVTFSEFTPADNIRYFRHRLAFHPEEQPLIAQIYGKDVKAFIQAAKACEDMGFSGIDINMGCPAKKVVRSEHGVALRKKPELAYKLVEALASNTSLPVSVKTRLGWSNADDLITFAQGIEKAGANMICVHARTYLEPYKESVLQLQGCSFGSFSKQSIFSLLCFACGESSSSCDIRCNGVEGIKGQGEFSAFSGFMGLLYWQCG